MIGDRKVLHEHPVTMPNWLLQVNSKVGEVLSGLHPVFTVDVDVLRAVLGSVITIIILHF